MFSEEIWRKCLSVLALEEIRSQLEVFERRFDVKYPPLPVSQPEPLDETDEGDGRRREVEEILKKIA